MFKVSPQDLSGIHQHFSEANKIFLLGPLYARVVGAPTVVSLKICDVAFNALKGLLEITGKLTVGTFTVLPNLMCLIAGYEQIHNPFSLKNGLKAFKLSILSLVTIPKIFCIYLIDPTLATFSQVRLESVFLVISRSLFFSISTLNSSPSCQPSLFSEGGRLKNPQ